MPSAFSDEEQVAEREQGEELGAVLGQPPVAGLHMAELALDDPEGMLDLGPDHGDHPVDALVERMRLATLGCLAHDTPSLAWPLERGPALGADIALVHCLAGHVYIPEKGPRLRSPRSAAARARSGCREAVRSKSPSCA